MTPIIFTLKLYQQQLQPVLIQFFSTFQSNIGSLFTTPTTSNARQNTTSVKNWVQNLISPHQPQHIQPESNGFQDPYPVRQYRSSFLSSNRFETHTHYSNLSLPLFWNSDVGLWFANAELTFSANGIFDKHKRLSMVLELS